MQHNKGTAEIQVDNLPLLQWYLTDIILWKTMIPIEGLALALSGSSSTTKNIIKTHVLLLAGTGRHWPGDVGC